MRYNELAQVVYRDPFALDATIRTRADIPCTSGYPRASEYVRTSTHPSYPARPMHFNGSAAAMPRVTPDAHYSSYTGGVPATASMQYLIPQAARSVESIIPSGFGVAPAQLTYNATDMSTRDQHATGLEYEEKKQLVCNALPTSDSFASIHAPESISDPHVSMAKQLLSLRLDGDDASHRFPGAATIHQDSPEQHQA